VTSAHERWAALAKPEHRGWSWEILRALYGSEGRHYHTMTHVAGCLDLLDDVVDPRVERTMATLAIFWHDAVYVPGVRGCEQLSADLLEGFRHTLAVDRRTLDFAKRCILATEHGGSWRFAGNPTVDTVIDIDLSILGSEPSMYDHYVRGVREEFRDVADDEAWRVGRTAFLKEVLGRSRIYLTEWGAEWFEYAARANIARELGELT
jgi:predicted metal-dependent HD superfamily phosphohydrolase